MNTNRRDFTALLGAGPLALLLPRLVAATNRKGGNSVQPSDAMSAEHDAMMKAIPDLRMNGSEQIAMVLYPGFTALDFVGPYYFFACLMGAAVHLVTTQTGLDPVASDLGLAIVPTIRLSDVPKPLDILFLPGGTQGTLKMMQDQTVLGFLRDRVSSTKYITSVCTGSMILAAAGMLAGKSATSHWVTRPVLADFGATPVNARVVRDGQIVTGAGVSAGLDLAIELVRLLRGDPYAQALMLQAEYAPQPPIKGGTIDTTEPQLAHMMQIMFTPLAAACHDIAEKNKGSRSSRT